MGKVARTRRNRLARVEYLKPGEGVPDGDGPWLIIERSDDGRYFGTGEGRTEAGETVFYACTAQADVSLAAALAAAQEWADRRQVPIIHVQEAVGA